MPLPCHVLFHPVMSPPLRPSFLRRYESSSEDSSTAENFSDNESTENEAAGPEERVPSVAEAPQLRPSGTVVAKTSQEECQPSQEPQHVLVEEGVSGANAEEEIRSVFLGEEGGTQGKVGDLCLRFHHSCPLREPPIGHAHLSLN